MTGYKISDEELAKDNRYIELLDNINPTPRGLGLKIVERLLKSQKVNEREMVPRLTTVIREPIKARSKKGLAMLDRIAKTRADLRNAVCQVAVEGLLHEAVDIQQAALDLLLKYHAFDDSEMVAGVRKIVPSLAASVSKSLPEILVDSETTPLTSPEKATDVPQVEPYELLKTNVVMALLKNLADKNPPVPISATDKMIDTIASGQLTAGQVIPSALKILELRILVLSRWLRPLKVIAEQSDVHAVFVHELLEGIVPDLPPRDAGGFVELLYELTVSLGRPITTKRCRQFLESLAGSGKAAKLGKKLLEM